MPPPQAISNRNWVLIKNVHLKCWRSSQKKPSSSFPFSGFLGKQASDFSASRLLAYQWPSNGIFKRWHYAKGGNGAVAWVRQRRTFLPLIMCNVSCVWPTQNQLKSNATSTTIVSRVTFLETRDISGINFSFSPFQVIQGVTIVGRTVG